MPRYGFWERLYLDGIYQVSSGRPSDLNCVADKTAGEARKSQVGNFRQHKGLFVRNRAAEGQRV